VDEEIDLLLEQGIIRPSRSPWSSPIVPVAKKGTDKVRVCIDYRKLNAQTEPDVYPMPRLEDMLERAAQSTWMSTMDLAKGYYQFKMAEEDIPKTAFVCGRGKFEFLRMPFGLKGAPSTFQRAMDQVFAHMPYVHAYIDDIIVTTQGDWDEHVRHLRETVKVLRDQGLTAKLTKCKLGRREVQFLGHRVGNGHTSMERAKVEAVQEYPRPQTPKQLRRFLGMAGFYRRFVRGYSSIAAPMTDMLTKVEGGKLRWTREREEAFENLKEALVSAPVLIAPKVDKPFTLHTDASTKGVGAVLYQEEEGELHPVAFFSKRLLKRQRLYGATELELLAILLAVEHFAVYLYGAHFQVITDHKALVNWRGLCGSNPRLVRWRLLLEQFSFEVSYKKGLRHVEVDAL